MTHLDHDHQSHRRPRGRIGTLLAASLLVAAGALYGSTSARAEPGVDTEGDSTHGGVYQALGIGVGPGAGCGPRQDCGGSAAIRTELPGYRYTTTRGHGVPRRH
jgi:hypothetical protein